MEFDALNMLIRLLNSNSETLKKHAVKSLIKRGSTAVAPLIREMKNNKEIRIDIAAILVKIGTPSIEPLKELLLEKDTELVLIAKAALYELGVNLKPEPVEKIKKEIQEESWDESITRCIHGLEEFSLQDIYSYREELARLHPKNRNIEAKIRQQLQLLRDRGTIEFLGKGRYRVITPKSARKVLVIQVDPRDPQISNIAVGDNITLSIEEHMDNIKMGNIAVLCSVEENGEILMHGISEVISELGNGMSVGKTGKGVQLKLRIKEKLGGIPIAASQIKDQGIKTLSASKRPKEYASVSMLTYDEWSKIAKIIQDSALIDAVRNGDIDAAKQWIEADVTGALKWVANREDLKTLQVLAEAGIDMNTALATVIKEDDVEVIRPIIKNGISTDYRNRNGWTALMKAAANGQTETAVSLIETGADIDAKNGDEWTALMLASNRGHVDTVKALIDAGADIEARNRYGFTAGMLAAIRGFTEVTKVLTDAGAHIDPALKTIAGIEEIEAAVADENGKSNHDLEQQTSPPIKSNSDASTDETIVSTEEEESIMAGSRVIDKKDNKDKQSDTKYWKGIVQVVAGEDPIGGLREDGSVAAVGNNGEGQCDFKDEMIEEIANDEIIVSPEKDDSVTVTKDKIVGESNKLNMLDIRDIIRTEEKIEKFPEIIEKNFGSNAVKDLLEWLSDPEWRVRWVAVKALEMTAHSLSYEERENIERRLNDAIKEENNTIVKSTLIDVCGKIAPFEPEMIKVNTEKEIETEVALKSAIESCATINAVWKDDKVNHEKRILEEKFNEEIRHIGINANVFVSTKPKHKHFAIFRNGDGYSIVLFALEPMSFKNRLVTSFKGRTDNELHRALMDAIEEMRRKTNPAVIPAKTRGAKKRTPKTGSESDKEIAKEIIKIRNSESIEKLINRLANEEYEEIRDAAATRLAELKDQRAADYLSKCLLKDPSASVRKNCAMALGEIGGSRAISALSEASNDSDTTVKHRALKSLQKIGGECVIDGISRFLRDDEPTIKFSAVLALKSIGGASSIDVLQRFLTYENDPSLRKLATDCINEMGRQR
ncbi:MAG: HEAT repeat domain-containing protein [Candidatus Thermoplasmatota archaeon]|nr:HEAT repeat domain-containing protein [Candidatus Thermoplasmatota archaeon]